METLSERIRKCNDTVEDQALADAAEYLRAACKRTLDLSDHADGCRSLVANISELRTPEQREANAKKCDCHLAYCRAALAKSQPQGA